MMYRIVEADNPGSDSPDECFVGPALPNKAQAEQVAIIFNLAVGVNSLRAYFVADEHYELQPWFI